MQTLSYECAHCYSQTDTHSLRGKSLPLSFTSLCLQTLSSLR